MESTGTTLQETGTTWDRPGGPDRGGSAFLVGAGGGLAEARDAFHADGFDRDGRGGRGDPGCPVDGRAPPEQEEERGAEHVTGAGRIDRTRGKGRHGNFGPPGAKHEGAADPTRDGQHRRRRQVARRQFLLGERKQVEPGHPLPDLRAPSGRDAARGIPPAQEALDDRAGARSRVPAIPGNAPGQGKGGGAVELSRHRRMEHRGPRRQAADLGAQGGARNRRSAIEKTLCSGAVSAVGVLEAGPTRTADPLDADAPE